MSLFDCRRPKRRKPRCLNSGSIYGALSALLFVVAKTVKYSGGGGRQDLPWAILLILVAAVIGGFLWQLGGVLFGPRMKAERDHTEPEEPTRKNESLR
jgi:hypothetical protein